MSVLLLNDHRNWEDIAMIDQRLQSQYWYAQAKERLDEPVSWAELEAAAADPTPLRHRDKLELGFFAQLFGRTAHQLIEDAITWGRLLPREVKLKKSPWKQMSASEAGELRAVIEFWQLSGERVEPPPGRSARPPSSEAVPTSAGQQH